MLSSLSRFFLLIEGSCSIGLPASNVFEVYIHSLDCENTSRNFHYSKWSFWMDVFLVIGCSYPRGLPTHSLQWCQIRRILQVLSLSFWTFPCWEDFASNVFSFFLPYFENAPTPNLPTKTIYTQLPNSERNLWERLCWWSLFGKTTKESYCWSVNMLPLINK